MKQLEYNRKPGLMNNWRFIAGMGTAVARLGLLRLAEALARLKYNTIRMLFNSIPDRIPSIHRLAKLAEDYYNSGLTGGESFMEVGKTLYYIRSKRVQMIVSLKPFGCMPSGVSDGIQPLVRAQNLDTLFLSVETSCEGSTNAQSRMLMVLNTARQRARGDYDAIRNRFAKSDFTLPMLIERRIKKTHALSRVNSHRKYASRAANELHALTKKKHFFDR